jgi:ArsR family transcriptional regulator, arsenate/arsenite/antimonite-responsive transcriptional repressor / arsenate reductase (thioredoxin)
MAGADHATPAFVRLAAHPLRWRLLTELAASDRRVRELVELVGEPQNLVSYHLRLLRDGELVAARRSSYDARDSYYRLDLDRCAQALRAVGVALHPSLRLELAPAPATTNAGRSPRRRVLFTCTGNSARSPIAEALLRHRAGGRVDVTSAGSHPRPRIHPNAVRVLRMHCGGIDVDEQRPRHLNTVTGRRFDFVISLCDRVREVDIQFRDRPRRIHWSIPDPADYPDFERAAAEIDTRIRYLLPVLTHTGNTEVQP